MILNFNHTVFSSYYCLFVCFHLGRAGGRCHLCCYPWCSVMQGFVCISSLSVAISGDAQTADSLSWKTQLLSSLCRRHDSTHPQKRHLKSFNFSSCKHLKFLRRSLVVLRSVGLHYFLLFLSEHGTSSQAFRESLGRLGKKIILTLIFHLASIKYC